MMRWVAVVGLVGASLVRQTLGALQCQLEAASLRRAHERTVLGRMYGRTTGPSDDSPCVESQWQCAKTDAPRCRSTQGGTRACGGCSERGE